LVTAVLDALAAARLVETVGAPKPELLRDEDAERLAARARDELGHAHFLPALRFPRLPVAPGPCKPVAALSAERSFVEEVPKSAAVVPVAREQMVLA